MSETVEIYKAMRDAGRAKRKKNARESIAILERRGIQFESKNFGIHLVIQCEKGVIDFWPSTGKFISRYDGSQGRGVFNLLRLIDRT